MRKIKFRGRSIETGEWAFGHLFYFDDGRCFISPTGSEVVGDEGEYPAEYVLRGVICLEVKPESVGQYTGIDDINKKNIYEDDIITYPHSIHPYRVVIFDDGAFKQKIHEINSGSNYLWIEDCIEVVGNVFDTPELLETYDSSEE